MSLRKQLCLWKASSNSLISFSVSVALAYYLLSVRSQMGVIFYTIRLIGYINFLCIRFLILFADVYEHKFLRFSLTEYNLFSLSDKLLLPTGQLHQVQWKMFSPLNIIIKILFFIILFIQSLGMKYWCFTSRCYFYFIIFYYFILMWNNVVYSLHWC